MEKTPVQQGKRERSRARRASFGVVVAVFLAVTLELLSFGAGKLLQRKWCMYRSIVPNIKQELTYSDYLARRDPVTGWPYPEEMGSERYDPSGARPSPASPYSPDTPTHIALYGDSFTASPNTDEEAWGNVLAGLLNRRVANYGGRGYGSDQALLRFRANEGDEAKVVVFGHLSEDIVRNLCRNRDLLTYTQWFAYKPRFILDASGGLELVPLPRLTEEEHLRFLGLADPRMLLEHESFAPGGPAGVVDLTFPFTFAVLKNCFGYQMRARFADHPPYAQFYGRGHPLQGLEITASICEAFTEEAQAREQHPIVLLFPTREDIEDSREKKEWHYANLLLELEQRDVEFLDFGPHLAAHIGDRPLDDFYDDTAHFKPNADVLLAKFIADYVTRLGF